MTRGNALLPLSLHLSCLSIKTTATSAATSRNDKCAAFPPPSSNDSLLTLFPIAYRTSIVEFPEGKFAILFRLVPLGDGARPLGGRKKKKKKEEAKGSDQHTSLPRGVGTGKSTVLLCRLANQTIVCSPMGHGRRREKRSRIDPRRHRQLITQIYVPIVHCLSRPGAVHGPSNHSPPRGRERFDGRASSLSLSLSQRRRRKDREDDRVVDENEEDDNGRASGGKRHARIGWNRPATEKGTQGGPPMHAELRPLPASLSRSLFPSLPPFSSSTLQDVVLVLVQDTGMQIMLVHCCVHR